VKIGALNAMLYVGGVTELLPLVYTTTFRSELKSVQEIFK